MLKERVINKSASKQSSIDSITVSIKSTNKQKCIQFINKLAARSIKKGWIKIQ